MKKKSNGVVVEAVVKFVVVVVVLKMKAVILWHSRLRQEADIRTTERCSSVSGTSLSHVIMSLE